MGYCGDLQANTAVDVLIGPFIDDTDGKTAETGLTISQADVLLSKNGQALAQKNNANAATHDAQGYYNCELSAIDMNTEGSLTLVVNEAGALPVRCDFMVMSQAAYLSHYGAKDTGYMDVNMRAVSEDTVAADNLEAACDGTTYNIGGGVVVVASVTGAAGSVTGAVGSVTAGVGLADGAITAAKFDETTAFPLKSADTGATAVARTAAVDAIKAKTDNLPVDPADQSAVEAAITAAHATTDGKVDAVDDYVDTEIAAIVTHLTDIKGATFNGATDSLEAVRDRGDAAWATATGFSTLDAAGVRTAVGLVAANLDTQIADVPTVAEFGARSLPAADYTVVTDLGTVQSGDTFARLGAPAGASVSADVAAVKSDTAAILVDTDTTLPATLTTIEGKVDVVDGVTDAILLDTVEIGAAGVGLTAVPWNAAWDAEVQSEVDDALGAAISEPAALTATKSVKSLLWWVYSRFYLKNTQTAGEQKTYKADGLTVLATRSTGDDGTTQVLGAGS